MTDLFRLVGPPRPPGSASASASASDTGVRPSTERSSGRSSDARTPPAALQAALDRLDQFLKSGTPPRTDAPKGFYLNVVV